MNVPSAPVFTPLDAVVIVGGIVAALAAAIALTAIRSRR